MASKWARIECTHRTTGGRPVSAYLGDLALIPDSAARFYCRGCKTLFHARVTGALEVIRKKIKRGCTPFSYSGISFLG